MSNKNRSATIRKPQPPIMSSSVPSSEPVTNRSPKIRTLERELNKVILDANSKSQIAEVVTDETVKVVSNISKYEDFLSGNPARNKHENLDAQISTL